MPSPSLPMSLVAELTYRCPLQCAFCYNPIEFGRYLNELDTATWNRVLDEAAQLGVIHVHFSGGEPVVRRDLEEMISRARSLDLYTNLSTGGMLTDERRLSALKEAGLDALQISLLDSQAPLNDRMAGAPSFEKKVASIELAKTVGFALTLNVVLHRHNLQHLEEIFELAAQWEIERLELAHVQYIGWAFRNRACLLPTWEQLETARELVKSARNRLEGKMEILHVLPDYHQDYPKPCLQGWARTFMTVAPDGAVLPCHSAREIPGLDFPSVKDQSLEEIWYHDPVFMKFRGYDWMPEPCRSCDRKEIDFGGCRCQAFLLTGDAASTDPVCHKAPTHHLFC